MGVPLDPPISTRARILAVAQEGRLFQVELPNGKIVFAFPARGLTEAAHWTAGQRVTVELTAYDLSKARITGSLP